MKNFILILFILFAGGCMKMKEDNKIPFLDVTNGSSSAIRLFNFMSAASYNGSEVTINNVPLTAHGLTNGGGGTPIGLSLFPTGVWPSGDNGSPFSVPNSLLDKDGNAHILIGGYSGINFVDTVVENDVVHPKDYYLLSDGHLRVLERDNLPSTRAGYFKLRIINLGNPNDNLGLGGAVSLTYADGSDIDALLNNVAAGQISAYAELPYDSYQFKLFVSGDVTKQIPEMPLVPYWDPCNPALLTQEGNTPQVRTFKPGGVYSIVVTPNYYKMLTCDKQNGGIIANGYRTITELDPGVNYIYAHMQAVNAMPGKEVTIQVDGKPLGGPLSYIGATELTKAIQAPGDMFVQGNHRIQVMDASGKELAGKNITLYPADHYTIWAYEQPDGTAGILFEANEMTGTLYVTGFQPNGPSGPTVPDDGTNGIPKRKRYPYSWESRFLNMSPDLPYATFTNDQQLFLPAAGINTDTMRYLSAYTNLASCQQPLQNVSLIYSVPFISPSQADNGPTGNSERSYFPGLIRVYQSKPGAAPEIPGTILPDIAPLETIQAFVANENLYTDPRFKYAEMGVYTVAVVGRTSKSAPAAEKARIIVIKHNK
jgi:hypothetical protein